MPESPTELQLELEKLERKHAENPEGRYFVPLANAYRKLGNVELAERLLRDGLRKHPDYLSAHIVLGRCLADRGATREAASEFRYVLSLDPQNLIALRTLGELAGTEGRPEEAGRWYRELLEVDPLNEDARAALASLDSMEPDGLGAPEDFEEVTSWWERPLEPPVPEPSVEMSESGPYDADPGGGEDEPESPELVTETIAELYARQGLFDRAADVYRELIRRRGGDPTLQHRLDDLLRPGGPAEPEPDYAAEVDALELATAEPDTLAEPEPEAELPEETDAFAASFADGFGSDPADGDEGPAAPIEGQSYLEDPSSGLGPEPETSEQFWLDEAPLPWLQESEPQMPSPSSPDAATQPEGRGIVSVLAELAAWMPGRSASSATQGEEREPEAAPGPEPDDVPIATPIAASDDLFPWELPAPPRDDTGAAAPAAPVAPAPVAPAPPADVVLPAEPVDTGFSFEEFFGDRIPMPDAGPRPAPEAPPRPPDPVPEPAVDPAPPPATESAEDDDLESFQAWLRSLKR